MESPPALTVQRSGRKIEEKPLPRFLRRNGLSPAGSLLRNGMRIRGGQGNGGEENAYRAARL